MPTIKVTRIGWRSVTIEARWKGERREAELPKMKLLSWLRDVEIECSEKELKRLVL